MTYYGVWSGKEKEWWGTDGKLFYSTMLGVAKAQAVVANNAWVSTWPHVERTWEVRAIGEDGLPEEKGIKVRTFHEAYGREALDLLDPRHSECVKSRHIDLGGRLVVECTLPLDVETAVGLQILGDRAAADPGLELTILASLER